MAACVLVASGPSAKGFVPPEGATVFAVNGAIEWLSRADYWFTLDPSPVNMRRMKNRRLSTLYFAAVPPDVNLEPGVIRLERVSADPSPQPLNVYDEYWFWRWGCVGTMSDDPAKINTGNSAWGALQLARLLGFNRILLVGVDGSASARVEGGKPNNLSHLPQLFNGVSSDIAVVNAGKMQCAKIPNMTISEGLKWLMQ